MRKKILLPLNKKEAVALVKYLKRQCDSKELSDVLYRLSDIIEEIQNQN